MRRKNLAALSIITSAALFAGGCGRKGYDGFEIPQQEKSSIKPVDNNSIENHYEGVDPTDEKTLKTFTSADGLCTIECKKSYYDVTLDYEKGSYYDVGRAYAETILKVMPKYVNLIESYIYENIKSTFPNLDVGYAPIKKRSDHFYSTLREEYRQELDGIADGLVTDSEGFVEDGKISRDEVILLEFVPDALRPTACSAISMNGSRTASGERITSRILEWQLGSENQLGKAHACVHFKNGEKSFTSITLLGFMPILTAVNSDGLMIGEFDAGSPDEYTCKNKKSYTYDMRYAIENCGSAREAAEYMAENAKKYPFSVNILATDRNEAVCTELAVSQTAGTAVVRDGNEKLLNGLEWSDKECLCVVNSFVTDGNYDQISGFSGNIVRWKKYERLFCGQDGMTVGRFKELLTSEKLDDRLVQIRSAQVVHIVIADYETQRIQAVFTEPEGVAETPEFIDLGCWEG